MDCFDCIFTSMDDLAYLKQTFPLVSQFLASCSTCSKSTNNIKPNDNISTKCGKGIPLVWEKVLFYTEVKFSY